MRNIKITVKLSEKEKKQLDELAKKYGLSLSSYVRMRCLATFNNIDVDIQNDPITKFLKTVFREEEVEKWLLRITRKRRKN